MPNWQKKIGVRVLSIHFLNLIFSFLSPATFFIRFISHRYAVILLAFCSRDTNMCWDINPLHDIVTCLSAHIWSRTLCMLIGTHQYGWSKSCSEMRNPRFLPDSTLFTCLSALHTIKGNGVGGYVHRELRETDEGGPWKRNDSMGALRGAPGWGAPILRTPKDKSRNGAFLS